MNDEERRAKQQEIESNLQFFLTALPTIPTTHKGKFALLRHREIVGYYDTVADALGAATKLYPDNMFSVQQVTDAAVNLGFYSHAVPLATAQ
jgi:hypothetical protein